MLQGHDAHQLASSTRALAYRREPLGRHLGIAFSQRQGLEPSPHAIVDFGQLDEPRTRMSMAW